MKLSHREFLTAVMKEASTRIPRSPTSRFFSKAYVGLVDNIMSRIQIGGDVPVKVYREFILEYNINPDSFTYTQVKMFYIINNRITMLRVILFDKKEADFTFYDIDDIDDYIYNDDKGYAVRLFRESE